MDFTCFPGGLKDGKAWCCTKRCWSISIYLIIESICNILQPLVNHSFFSPFVVSSPNWLESLCSTCLWAGHTITRVWKYKNNSNPRVLLLQSLEPFLRCFFLSQSSNWTVTPASQWAESRWHQLRVFRDENGRFHALMLTVLLSTLRSGNGAEREKGSRATIWPTFMECYFSSHFSLQHLYLLDVHVLLAFSLCLRGSRKNVYNGFSSLGGEQFPRMARGNLHEATV